MCLFDPTLVVLLLSFLLMIILANQDYWIMKLSNKIDTGTEFALQNFGTEFAT